MSYKCNFNYKSHKVNNYYFRRPAMKIQSAKALQLLQR